ncbi:MAG TPA: riboflavin kinase [Candidatus Saccharimonadales bacterium]|nr:riboflavin kinase [Candidatus Saccharimonadales bacterium]
MPVSLPASLTGTITRFAGNGRKLGYPTANLTTKTSLKDGVYYGFANMGVYSHHPALIFIGTPTTVGDRGRRIEAWLLDIEDKDYYGLELKLDIRKYHRPNQTFDSVDELLVAMKADEATARQWFQN